MLLTTDSSFAINQMGNTVQEETVLDIEELHKTAVANGSTTYIDPLTGFTVFTEVAHLRRGKCCGMACRHCPYEWENVSEHKKKDTLPPCSSHKLENGEYKEIENSPNNDKMELSYDEDESKKETVKDGGKLGGKLTSKNVPYTRTGDKGTSAIRTGERLPKDDVLFEAMGTVDELCSFVGVAHAEIMSCLENDEADDYGLLPEALLNVMSRLFDIGSMIAAPNTKKTLDESHVVCLEEWIDQMTDDLPELNSFILPTGGKASAQLHVARTVCRRAERRLLPLQQDSQKNNESMFRYINRLSDFFFTAARYTNYCEGRNEVQYRRSRPLGSNKESYSSQRGRVTVNLHSKHDETA